MLPQDNQGQRRNDDGQRQPGWNEQNVEQQNVDDDGTKQRQSERNESPNQAEHAADYLQRSHQVNVMADEQGHGEVAGRAAGRRRHVKELQENVQSKKNEHATQENSSNRSDEFHSRRRFQPTCSRISLDRAIA